MIRNNITEVAYNVQTTVDAKNNIPIDYKVTNQNGSRVMGNMVQRAKSILGTNEFTVLYDKGYHTGSELKTAQDLGIETEDTCHVDFDCSSLFQTKNKLV